MIKKKKHYRDVCKFGIAGNFYFQFRISFRVIAIFRDVTAKTNPIFMYLPWVFFQLLIWNRAQNFIDTIRMNLYEYQV